MRNRGRNCILEHQYASELYSSAEVDVFQTIIMGFDRREIATCERQGGTELYSLPRLIRMQIVQNTDAASAVDEDASAKAAPKGRPLFQTTALPEAH